MLEVQSTPWIIPEQPAGTPAGLLELLQRDQQLRDDLAVSCSRDEARLQMAQPPQPTEELWLEAVQRAVDEPVANPRARVCGGEAVDGTRSPV